ncbi:MAG: hypothetical protein SFU21_09940 [Flavihumibacter sp.]|nr:hypothetical protein [Flavihumibacter sp.]
MLPSFEHITYNLTDFEKKTMVPLLVAGFKKMCALPGKVFSNAEIRAAIEKRHNIKITDIRMREMISYISIELQAEFGEYYLAAGAKGYYMTNDTAHIRQHAESLASRMASMQARMDVAMKKYNQLQNRQTAA